MVSIFTEEGESRESELPSNNELVGEDGLQKTGETIQLAII